MTRPTRLQSVSILIGLAVLLGAILTGVHVLRPEPSALLSDAEPPVTVECTDDRDLPVPAPVTSATLLSCPDTFDGQRVRVVGEAVGDLLDDRQGHWVLLNDDVYAFSGPLTAHRQALGTNGGIAVLLPEGMMPGALGGPGIWGDLLAVDGTFHIASREDQGGPAVIADAVEVLRSGRRVEPASTGGLRVTAVVMTAVAAIFAAQAWRRHP